MEILLAESARGDPHPAGEQPGEIGGVVVPGPGGERVVAEAEIPEELRRVWAELGGAPEAWNTALT